MLSNMTLGPWSFVGRRLALAAGVGALFGCAADPTPAPSTVSRIVVSSVPATARNGEPLAPAPVVQLADGSGAAVAKRGVTVTVVLEGSGRVDGVVEARTDDDGKARFPNLAISGPVGSYRLVFATQGLSAVATDPVQLTPGRPVAMIAVRGLNATGEVSQPVAESPVVRLDDGSGNPVPDVEVSFQVVAGGGSLAGATARTRSDGTAAAGEWMLGPTPGLNKLSVSASAIASPLEFTATAVLGPPAALVVINSAVPSQVAGTSIDTTVRIKVTDRANNPIAGVRVAFSVTGGGGTVTGGNPLTNADGIALLQKWNLGPEPGENTLAATVTGLTATTIRATATPVPVEILAGQAQVAFVGDPLADSLVVRVVNGAGVPKAGVTVTFQVTAGGGQVSPASAVTDSTGRAATEWVLGSGGGPHTIRMSAVGAAPTEATATGERFVQISAGFRHACGLSESGQAYCWGDNGYKQLGGKIKQFGQYRNPVKVNTGVNFVWVAASAGGNFSCGLAADSTGYCWGSNNHGQRADGQAPNFQSANPYPTPLVGGLRWKVLTVGGDHACGISVTGEGYCWGSNTGSLGDGTTLDRAAPTLVVGGLLWKTIEAGQAHTCAVSTADELYCWGLRNAFQAGPNDYLLSPTQIVTPEVFVAVTAGWYHTCGRTAAGAAYCWGRNDAGQLGTGANSSVPLLVSGGQVWAEVVGRGNTTCGRTTAGATYCWGENSAGEVGDGSLVDQPTPVLAAGGLVSTQVGAGGAFSCAIVGARPLCWGQNNYAQIGDGTTTNRAVPTRVRF